MTSYETPAVTDYGTLTDLTAQGNQLNADIQGNPNSAYSV